MWIGAELTIQPKDPQGREVITWSTDPNPARGEQIAPFEEQNPNKTVIVEPSTYDKNLVQAAAGLGPDLIECYSVSDMATYVESGLLLDLTPYAEEYGFAPKTTWPKLRNNLMVDGKLYRYPANSASQVLFFNKRLFREAGVDFPTSDMTWDEFIELVQPLTKQDDEGRYTQFAFAVSKNYVKDIILQFGGRFYSDDLTQSGFDSDEFVEGMEFYSDLVFKHKIVASPEVAESLSGAGGWASGELNWFLNERAATLLGSRWMLVIFRRYPELHKELGCVLLPHPVGKESKSYSGARGPGINVNADNLEGALEFLGYLASEEYGEVIAQSADALPPNADYGAVVENLYNEEYPEETYQQVFIDSMNKAEPFGVSPFVDAKVVDRTWEDAFDLVVNGDATPRQALEEAARQINRRIEQNINSRHELMERFEQARGRVSTQQTGG